VAEDLREHRDGWADDVEATILVARTLVAISALPRAGVAGDVAVLWPMRPVARRLRG
jgi:hypothetical protein